MVAAKNGIWIFTEVWMNQVALKVVSSLQGSWEGFSVETSQNGKKTICLV